MIQFNISYIPLFNSSGKKIKREKKMRTGMLFFGVQQVSDKALFFL